MRTTRPTKPSGKATKSESRTPSMRSPGAKRRALIEQTKAMLMFVYGIDADGAFQLLRWQSQQHNVKLRLIAEQISKDLVELSRANGRARRHTIDGLMLTAHQRIAHVAARQKDGQSKTHE